MLLKLTANAPRNREMMMVIDPELRREIPYEWLDVDTIQVDDRHPSATIVHLNLPRTQQTPDRIAAAKSSVLNYV